MTASNKTQWWSVNYPSRYYAYANKEYLLGGYPTPGYVDVAMFEALPTWLPIASDMIALTAGQWQERGMVDQIIKDGAVQTYVAPTASTTGEETTATSTATTTTSAAS
ncbi:hypothetical protein [Acetobacter okinawensis]|uniref:Uncharacterized protein n=1 Tax=Acetobacter okinawensis TaxID=1076594 RepID=A0A252BTT9_9PROT|nr:hypothetical protein [Acetobacter okinawensis]OUJ12330.1 hypothetical protein HK26_02675 [Acetobacter okinawensis]